MTYRFKLLEPIGHGVARLAREQFEIAEAKLASKDDISASIHDARRCLKRVRALLRLIERCPPGHPAQATSSSGLALGTCGLRLAGQPCRPY